jgi:glycosyltransferase involved in cell wall biosynthesis
MKTVIKDSAEAALSDTVRSPRNPLVSIIIPYYKQEAFIVETVWSAKLQTYPRVEIIVVDDGSPSPAEAPLRGIEGITLVRTENRGCPAARNMGFRYSSGEYLIFLDADDRLSAGAIKAHLQSFERNPEAVMTFGAVRRIDEHGTEICAPHICRPRKRYLPMLFGSNPIACPGAAMIRRSTFIEIGLWDESFLIVEDYRMYLKLAKRHSLVQHDYCVVDYRFHSSSLSQNKERMLQATLAALDCVEREHLLTASERREIEHGRRRWMHAFRPEKTITYRLRGLFYRFHAMLKTPVRSYFRRPTK